MSPHAATNMVDFTCQESMEQHLTNLELSEHDEFCMNPKDYEMLRNLPGNDVCIDCGGANPTWGAPNLGIFFCLSCSGQHRAMGTHISFVRSVQMDSWSTNDIERMAIGGNQQCHNYLASHGITKASHPTIPERYDCAPALLYQDVLKARRNQQPEPTVLPNYSSPRLLQQQQKNGQSSDPTKRQNKEAWKHQMVGFGSPPPSSKPSPNRISEIFKRTSPLVDFQLPFGNKNNSNNNENNNRNDDGDDNNSSESPRMRGFSPKRVSAFLSEQTQQLQELKLPFDGNESMGKAISMFRNFTNGNLLREEEEEIECLDGECNDEERQEQSSTL